MEWGVKQEEGRILWRQAGKNCRVVRRARDRRFQRLVAVGEAASIGLVQGVESEASDAHILESRGVASDIGGVGKTRNSRPHLSQQGFRNINNTYKFKNLVQESAESEKKM